MGVRHDESQWKQGRGRPRLEGSLAGLPNFAAGLGQATREPTGRSGKQTRGRPRARCRAQRGNRQV